MRKVSRFHGVPVGCQGNLDKIKAVLEMESLKNVKEVQSLNGRVAALIGSPFE